MNVYDCGPSEPFAMRHIVHDSRRGEYYITAMGASRVYRLSDSGQWRGYWQVGSKPNTCDISPDGRWLAVSCRDPIIQTRDISLGATNSVRCSSLI